MKPDQRERAVWLQAAEHSGASVAQAIDAGVRAVDRLPRGGERWTVKLNLTYPTRLPGVVNSAGFIEGICQWARDSRVKLTFIEGEGGNGAYSARDTFDGNGVTEIADRYGMSCVSISEKPWEWRDTVVQGKTIRLPYSPYFRRHDYDRFITAPLFKNHIFTIVTLGMKNLWGCIPDAYRMYYHHVLDHGIVALHKELQPDFSIFDGLIALRGRGPMDGQPLDFNAVMVSGGVGVGEIAALQLMGISLDRVRHLQLASAEGLLPAVTEIEWLADPKPFMRNDFILERSWINRLSAQIAKFPKLQRIVYHSAFSTICYAVVHRFRGESAQTALINAKHAGNYNGVGLSDR